MATQCVHEKQGWNQHCARHCINNLLQLRGAVTKAELDDIASQLFRDECALLGGANVPLFNPNKSALGLGNYSIGVIEAALRARGFDCSERLLCGPGDTKGGGVRGVLPARRAESLVGFIVNRPATVCLVIHTRHWLPIVRVGMGAWRNLDSQQSSPSALLDLEGLWDALQTEVDRGADVLLVSQVATERKEEGRAATRAAAAASAAAAAAAASADVAAAADVVAPPAVGGAFEQ